MFFFFSPFVKRQLKTELFVWFRFSKVKNLQWRFNEGVNWYDFGRWNNQASVCWCYAAELSIKIYFELLILLNFFFLSRVCESVLLAQLSYIPCVIFISSGRNVKIGCQLHKVNIFKNKFKKPFKLHTHCTQVIHIQNCTLLFFRHVAKYIKTIPLKYNNHVFCI